MARRSTLPPLFGVLLLFLFVGVVADMAGAESMGAYRLAAGDKVRIAVFGEDDLSVDRRVSDRGSISLPLLGELSVEGLTPAELERLVTSKLKGPYLVDPKVTVSIEEYREFFVMGQVNRPGGYPYIPGLTVRKAISLAGGFTERAARSKIYIVNDSNPSAERRVDQRDSVSAGETIVVKESFF